MSSCDAFRQMADSDNCECVCLCGDLGLLAVAPHRRLSSSLYASAKGRFASTCGGVVRPAWICFHGAHDESHVGGRTAATLDDRAMCSTVSLLSAGFRLRRVVGDWFRRPEQCRFEVSLYFAMRRGPNGITGASAGQRLGFAVKSRVVLRPRPGVAQFHR